MKRGMKFLSLLLVFVMVFSMLPSTNVLLAAELSSYKGVTSFAEGNHKLIIDTSSSGITYTYKDEYVSIKTTDANDPYFTVNLVDTSMSGKIMAIKLREYSVDIVELFEELLEAHDITIPDEDRTGDECEARLYGTTYSDLEDEVKHILSQLVLRVKKLPDAEIDVENLPPSAIIPNE